ncbi:CaiB/BaiF CoA transferase family protein [Thermodesulfobacteriota bacterium]
METVRSLLSKCSVLDLTGEMGQFCGKILADLGAVVIKVEPPRGDPARHIAPFVDDDANPDNSLFWLAMNTGKKSIVLDIETSDGRAKFLDLVKHADIVLETFAPGYMERIGLGWEVLSKKNSGLIMTAITPFGRTGPYRDYSGSDLICMALSGEMNLCGSPDDRPLRITVPQAHHHVSIEGVIGSLFAYQHRLRTGVGQYVDVSAQQAIAWEGFNNQCYWHVSRCNLKREGRWRGFADGQRMRMLFECKDGYILSGLGGGRVSGPSQIALTRWIDSEGMADDYLRNFDWMAFGPECHDEEIWTKLEKRIAPFYKTKTKNELFERAFIDRFLLGPVYNTKDIYESRLFKGEHKWARILHEPTGKMISYPARPYSSSIPNYAVRGAAPLLGQDNQEILGSKTESIKTGQSSVQTQPSAEAPKSNGLLFENLKILDLSWVIAGPAAVRYFADYGAQVIHVESRVQIDVLRTGEPYKNDIYDIDGSAYFAVYNTNKYGITLDFKTPKGMEIVKRLVAWADVVVENFSPGVIEKLGLGYDELKTIKPDIIMVSTSQLGKDGPPFRGFGSHGAALAGFWSVTGYPDGEPNGLFGAYCDFIANRYIIIAILAALEEKRQTGRGQAIDQAQVEASLQFLAPALLEYSVNGRVTTPQGNRDPHAAPHSAYRCKGDDAWCAIAVFTDDQWNALKGAMGNPPWTEENRFSTLYERKANEDELDQLMDEWTLKYDPYELMAMLQAVKVPTGAVAKAKDLHEDPQMMHRGHYLTAGGHPVLETYTADTPAFRMSLSKARDPMPSPVQGQHNEYMAKEILKLSREEIEDLEASGAFGMTTN